MQNKRKIVFFDGVCHLCSGSVQFLLRHDRKKELSFCALQSPQAHEILAEYSFDLSSFESIVFFRNNIIFTHSDAIIEIACELGGFWKMAVCLRIIPKVLRDAVYSVIARSRYSLFGKAQECWLPTPELRARFIDM